MIAIFIWTIFCIGLAFYNYDRITAGKRIYHGINGALHLGAAFAAYKLYDWQTGVSVLLTARVVFDTALNAMRGLSFGYLGKKPLTDRIERKVFGGGEIAKIVYVVAVALLMLLR